ncbi:hypothetical protein TBLA_0A06430 [Henningerozyma blattae CBS 6284]|uniref:Complex 1 LYR protein domain-containing protein n=1 Tax=Henningerozyma blattae (strain ATCC 34711 / CBS 6284 / DSM 70876 / NBRC 10599 / NRRL Y-10934 / UCD 77-7) TaxID=1071380 RepID=I2GWD3_HENB6|nr:hypothetical protein TBLA_0A06430 [Tetrapisispora blattae CBS 6284]CCH58435.1 hypothetical protein TBLA_0A06430 [Tetrapisispora blattae CBS 6284]
MVRKLCGLQRDVVHLYRSCIRVAHTKPVQSRPHFIEFARSEFSKNRDVPRKDFNTIEYLLRTGKRRLETYSSSEVKNIFGRKL